MAQVLGQGPALWSTIVTHVQGSQRSSVGSLSATLDPRLGRGRVFMPGLVAFTPKGQFPEHSASMGHDSSH